MTRRDVVELLEHDLAPFHAFRDPMEWIYLARDLRSGSMPTSKPPEQMVNKIQSLFVREKILTDSGFVRLLKADLN